MLQDQSELVKHGRVVFNIVCINITIMMVTDSVFSAIGPYFWMGDVFVVDDTLGKLYGAATALFYITNSFFVCLLLYVIYYFGLASGEQSDTPNSERKRGNSSNMRSISEYENRMSAKNPYLSIDDLETDQMLFQGSTDDVNA